MDVRMSFLDQLSTIHTRIGNDLKKDIEFQIEQSYADQAIRCDKSSPCICFQTRTGVWKIVQGCCNDWLCKRCGAIRARTEYVKIVSGAEELEKTGNKLFFLTLTCRGKSLDSDDAEKNYYKWCTKFLNAYRNRVRRAGDDWTYACVTERQKRGHPHSHLLTTAIPNDAILYDEFAWLPDGRMASHEGLWSDFIYDQLQRSELGRIYDMTEVRTVRGAAVYIAKYLFKSSMATVWPSGWKRVRYSRNWPKSPIEPSQTAFPLISYPDWIKVSKMADKVVTSDPIVYEMALARLVTNVKMSDNSRDNMV